MVKLRFTWLLLAFMMILGSCSEDRRFAYYSELYGDSKDFMRELVSLLDSYTSIYNKYPESVDDLLIFIDRIDNLEIKYYGNYRAYATQYLYLKNNRDKLIFVNDYLVKIYYKKIRDKNLLIGSPPREPCYNVISATPAFFDAQGYYIQFDSLSERRVERRLQIEYIKYLDEYADPQVKRFSHPRIILEYVDGELNDLCSGESINKDRSSFFENTYNYLDSLARANNLSRVTVPIFVP